ncbi:MAG: glycosyltransferase N-terminal domain-containing protein [Bacteroidota bacterium]
MRQVYTLVIYCYGLLVRAAALFSAKARLWVVGRNGLFTRVETAFRDVDRSRNPVIWFHVSSLGEFEQGRPIIEACRQNWPGSKILLTFFSPSGYEVRKNYPPADWVFYLPLDTPANACRWMDIVKPSMAIFVKYDFWFNMLNILYRKQVPVYFISVMFRPSQHFFKWYGGWFRRQLDAVTWFFAQNRESADLLQAIGKNNVTVTGDTRFDRVFSLAANRHSFPLVEQFAGDRQVFVCGSTWKEDEALLLPLINALTPAVRFIIAPHDTSPDRIRYILERVEQPVVRYSQLDASNAGQSNVLLIDSVGILAQLYQYATLAYVGGGFGAGLHNIQEPVTFGVPVFFGPRYHKFREAADLVELGGAVCVNGRQELETKARELLEDKILYRRLSELCSRYVEENRGATAKVMRFLKEKTNQIS